MPGPQEYSKSWQLNTWTIRGRSRSRTAAVPGTGWRTSWRAFEYAVQLGYSYLETDTRSIADGSKLIAFHDAELGRVTDRTGLVSKLTWKEVSAARINGTEEIPLLEDRCSARSRTSGSTST